MPHINDLMDPTLLADMIAQGYIRERRHPTLPLRILGYTETAQYAREWNDATLQCRGLVVDDAGMVIARPYRKFFGDGEHDGERLPALNLAAPVEVTDKADGSLGIFVPTPDGSIVATRGSFESEQAKWATAFFRRHYADRFTPMPGWTYLCEIIYAANRIVVGYDYEDLVLLGAVHVETGEVLPAEMINWPGRRIPQFPHRTLAEALAAPVRDNAEGFVVRYLDGSDLMVKIKLERYVSLHKIVTGLSEKTVWEHASAGKPFEELVADLPDEFHEWVTTTWRWLTDLHAANMQEARQKYADVLDDLPANPDRKTFALEVMGREPEFLRPWLFLLHDGNETKLNAAIWRAIKPSGDTFMLNSEDAA